MMNRIFHVKIMTAAYVWLFLLTIITGCAFWYMQALVGLAAAALLIVTIESLIHSTYTLTSDGRLVVYRGRFLRTREVSLADIADVERRHCYGMGGLLASDYVLVHLFSGDYLALVPVRPDDFIRTLVKRLEHRAEDE